MIAELKAKKVEILVDNSLANTEGTSEITEEGTWFEEFLDYKILLGQVDSTEEAIGKINTYGGGHSAVIVTEEEKEADFL